MLFNSVEYLLFFLVSLAVSWMLAGRGTLRIGFLLVASYYFYVSNNHWLIVLILISTQIDYAAGLLIERTDRSALRRLFLTLSVCGNLGILGFYKYGNFLVQSGVDLANAVGANTQWDPWQIVLPVGISFYTFQSMSYTLDVYLGKIPAERSWLRFSFFVAFFPQLVAGPIVRAADFLPQIGSTPRLSTSDLEFALNSVFKGLFKKIVLADCLAVYADQAFAAPFECSTLTAWIGVYAFAFQIYFDFSGYSDIAIGCSKLMGFDLPINFRQPYMATSFTDFWRRWHISLSTWLRDYLYIPLGGNRTKSRAGLYRNLMLTMLLGGLWHGAAWHFVLWGGLHGVALVTERVLGIAKGSADLSDTGPWRLGLRRVVVFHLILITWIFFRANDVPSAFGLLTRLVTVDAPVVVTYAHLAILALIGTAGAMQLFVEHTDLTARFFRWPIPAKAATYACFTLLIVMFSTGESKPFIYFQF